MQFIGFCSLFYVSSVLKAEKSMQIRIKYPYKDQDTLTVHWQC